jgi:LPXTG-motif cell wall-anchored protein
MKKILISLFLFQFAFVFGIHSAYAQTDKNCPDFATWGQAQEYFEANGGSAANNVDDLDRNHNGIACETSGLSGYNGETWASITHPFTVDGGTSTDGGEMPDTATNYVNGIVAGVVSIMAGYFLFFRKKRTN